MSLDRSLTPTNVNNLTPKPTICEDALKKRSVPPPLFFSVPASLFRPTLLDQQIIQGVASHCIITFEKKLY